MRPSASAATSSSVTTLAPRPTLMKSAPRFAASKKALPNRCFVSAVSGSVLTMTSARAANACRSALNPTSETYGGPVRPELRIAITFMPSACARFAVSVPMPPRPTTSIVLPSMDHMRESGTASSFHSPRACSGT
jgi:hypothetical protein